MKKEYDKWDDKEYVLSVVHLPEVFMNVSRKLRGDKDVVRTAVRNEYRMLKYASDILRDDEEIVLIATENHSCAIKYASDRLRDDFDFMSKAIMLNFSMEKGSIDYRPWAIEYVSDRLRDNFEFMSQFISMDSSLIEYASDHLRQRMEDRMPNNSYKNDLIDHINKLSDLCDRGFISEHMHNVALSDLLKELLNRLSEK